jgi:hypothetical protein
MTPKIIPLFKKWGSLSVLSMMLFGCATAIPQSIQKSIQKNNSDYQHWSEVFKEVKGLSVDDIPVQYNYSRLREGSKVKIKMGNSYSTNPDFTTKLLREIRVVDKKKLYFVEHISGGSAFTIKVEPLSLSKIIRPYESIHSDEELHSNIESTSKSARVEMELLAQSFKGAKLESKIIDFKLISDEQLIIAHQSVACKIYQVHTITRHVRPSSTEMMPDMNAIIDESEKIWISDDVPFGLVKSQSIQTLHMYSDPNSRFPIMADPRPQEMLREVVEFNY